MKGPGLLVSHVSSRALPQVLRGFEGPHRLRKDKPASRHLCTQVYCLSAPWRLWHNSMFVIVAE